MGDERASRVALKRAGASLGAAIRNIELAASHLPTGDTRWHVLFSGATGLRAIRDLVAISNSAIRRAGE